MSGRPHAVRVNDLRAESAKLQGLSEAAAARKVQLAGEMIGAPDALHTSLSYEQGVADCMMRRYRLWADQLELAARELEEP